MNRAGIKVFAPASIGNVGIGFDLMGIALTHPGDEIIARLAASPGVRITAIKGAKGQLPFEAVRNTAGKAALSLLQYLGKDKEIGIELELHKKMPFGSGLGSSAASAVAGAMAVNELLQRPLEKRDLLRFALAGETIASGSPHADNVAPSLLGGIILVRDHQSLDFVRLPVPPGLFLAVVYPHISIRTQEARAILKREIPLSLHTRQAGNLAAFVAALYRGDLELLARSLDDQLIEPQRAQLIPHFYEAKRAALQAGALGCSISGSGPSIFALCPNSLIAEQAAHAMQTIFTEAKIQSDSYCSRVNMQGAFKY